MCCVNGKNLRGGKISQISTLVLAATDLRKAFSEAIKHFLHRMFLCHRRHFCVVVGWREFSAFVVVDVCSLGNAADDVLRCFN